MSALTLYTGGGGLTPLQGNQLTAIEQRLISWDRWFGAAVTPNAEIHVADRIGTTQTAFRVDAGNDTWGNWLLILGSGDTPITAGRPTFDLHKLVVVAAERSSLAHFVQIAFGATGAAALTAGTYTEFVINPHVAGLEEQEVDVDVRLSLSGTKAWIRIMVPTQDTGTLDFFFGVHEYEVVV
jgi:hypothetical protein